MPPTLSQIGKYRIEHELGRGAMGVVYRAFDPVVERTVAIKTIRLDVENVEDLLNRLRREAKSVGQLEHPNIVTLYDAGEVEGLFYLAMQFIKGETLQDRLQRQRWFTLREVGNLFSQICAGLDYAHRHGVIHRDIKPANIMITEEGVVKLTDFGIAKLAGTGTTLTGLIVGTASYMSPEQAVGKPLDGRSDIFSLGSILYELITGEKAFPGQNTTTVMYKIVHEAPTPLAALQPGLDPAVEQMVQKALAKHPDQRFQTCSELAIALELYLNKAAAAIPKTSLAPDQPVVPLAQAAPPSAQGVPPPSPVAGPGSAGGVAPIAPAPSSPSAGALPGAVPVPQPTGTGTQLPAGPARIPLAWLGGGVLGTLLLVIVILMILQMRRPVYNPTPLSTPANKPTQTAAPPPSQASSAQLPSAQQPTSPGLTQPAPENTQPAPAPRAETPTSSPASRGQATAAKETKRPQPPRQVTPEPVRSTAQSPTPANAQAAAQPPAAPAKTETYESLIVKGDLAFQQGKYSDALNAYSKAYVLRPRSAEAKRKIATTYILMGKPEEAAKYQ